MGFAAPRRRRAANSQRPASISCFGTVAREELHANRLGDHRFAGDPGVVIARSKRVPLAHWATARRRPARPSRYGQVTDATPAVSKAISSAAPSTSRQHHPGCRAAVRPADGRSRAGPCRRRSAGASRGGRDEEGAARAADRKDLPGRAGSAHCVAGPASCSAKSISRCRPPGRGGAACSRAAGAVGAGLRAPSARRRVFGRRRLAWSSKPGLVKPARSPPSVTRIRCAIPCSTCSTFELAAARLVANAARRGARPDPGSGVASGRGDK